jgi:signal transduction histidine kinase
MRQRILLTVAAATGLVLLAFLLPLAVLVQDVAENRASNAATLTLQPLVPLVGSFDTASVRLAVDQVNAAADFPVTVFMPDGKVIGAPATRSAAVDLAATGQSLTAETEGGREVLVPVIGSQTAVVRVFVPDAELHEGVERARVVLVLLGVVLMGLALLVGDAVARSFLRPVRNLAQTADELASGDLTARATPDGPPETRAVARAMNRLAQRITVLLAAEREAVADLSHRLRTPVTALRLDAEGLVQPDERARLLDDVAALSRSVDDVIREARRPVREGGGEGCDAVEVVTDRVRFWSVLAEDTERAMSVDLPAQSLAVACSAEDLAGSVDALLGNVFAHTADGTPFSVLLQGRAGGGARLVVADRGAGWPSPDVVERGVSNVGSTGLGLDIARRTAEVSGGSLLLTGSADGGAVVTLDLGAPVA